MELGGKKIIVTGGTAGIGRELVKQCLSAGAQVITCGRNVDKLSALQKEFPNVHIVQADIATDNGRHALLAAAETKWGSVDFLINNAGVQYAMTIGEGNADQGQTIQDEIEINFTAQVLLIDLFLPLIKKSNKSAIVNICSCLALTPKRSAPVYCATKAALMNFSTALGYQLADTNVSVVSVFPPLVETEMTAGRGSKTITASVFAEKLLAGVVSGKTKIYVGKATLLRVIHRVFPSLAAKILSNS